MSDILDSLQLLWQDAIYDETKHPGIKVLVQSAGYYVDSDTFLEQLSKLEQVKRFSVREVLGDDITIFDGYRVWGWIKTDEVRTIYTNIPLPTILKEVWPPPPSRPSVKLGNHRGIYIDEILHFYKLRHKPEFKERDPHLDHPQEGKYLYFGYVVDPSGSLPVYVLKTAWENDK